MSSPPDPIADTQRTYTAVAHLYHTRNQDRSAVLTDLRHFSTLLPDDGLLVDLGCGPGFDAAILQAWGHRVLAVDLSQAMMLAGRPFYPHIPYLQADMLHLPLAANVAAGIWLSAALLHLPHPAAMAALIEARRVLKPGGLLYVSVKAGDGDGWTSDKFDRPRYFAYWRPAQLDAALAAAGFCITDGDSSGTWLHRFANLCG